MHDTLMESHEYAYLIPQCRTCKYDPNNSHTSQAQFQEQLVLINKLNYGYHFTSPGMKTTGVCVWLNVIAEICVRHGICVVFQSFITISPSTKLQVSTNLTSYLVFFVNITIENHMARWPHSLNYILRYKVQQNVTLHRKYDRYHHKTNTIVFSIFSAIKTDPISFLVYYYH